MKKTILLLIFIAAFLISACSSEQQIKQSEQTGTEIEKINYSEIKTLSDGTKYIIQPSEFRSGGPGKGGIGEEGGIPALLDPEFISVEEADYLPDEELVLGLVWNGEERAYPYRILVWHEIANDVVGGGAVLVTYCPLCFTGVAFKSTVDGKRELFGVSGKLYNSELVMYDKNTGSYWPQSLGMAVVGERSGVKLEKIPIDVATWGSWKKAHPDTKVLSSNTGFLRAYGSNPYGKEGDFSDIGFRLGVEVADPRLPEQTIVQGVEVDGGFKAYPDHLIREKKVINDKLSDKKIVVWLDEELGVPKVFARELEGKSLTFEVMEDKFTDRETNTIWNVDGEAVEGELNGKELERIVNQPIFWFAWAAFHPETEVYSG